MKGEFLSDRVRRACIWITADDTGLSSLHLWAVMMGVPPGRPYHPSDPSDLGRCLRLLQAVPEWKPRLPEMAAQSPYWAALVARWEELESLFLKEAGSYSLRFGTRADRTFDLMTSIENAVERQGKR